MAHPGWIIVFFVIATLVALGIGAGRLLGAMRQLRDHADVISSAPIFADAGMIALRAQRLSSLQGRVDELRARTDTAKQRLEAAAQELKILPRAIALTDARDDVRELIEELR